MEQVMSGSVLDFFKQMFNKIDSYFQKLDWSIQDKQINRETGAIKYTLTLSDEKTKINVYGTPSKGASDGSKYDITISSKNKPDKIAENVPLSKLEKTVTELAKKMFSDKDDPDVEFMDGSGDESADQESEEATANSSKKLSIRLKKVESATGVDVKLCAINANYSPAEALVDLDTLLDESTVVDLIPNDDNNYVIEVNEGDYNCTECDEVCGNVQESLLAILKPAYVGMVSLQTLVYLQPSIDYRHKDWLFSLRYNIETLSQLYVEQIKGMYSIPDMIKDAPITASIDYIESCIYEFISALDLYYCNFSHDIKKLFDDMIRQWKHEMEYCSKLFV